MFHLLPLDFFLPLETGLRVALKRFILLLFSRSLRFLRCFRAFLTLRCPELQALLPDDFDGDRVRIHRDTKTGNDKLLPVIAPLKRLLVEAGNQSTCAGLRGQAASGFRGPTSDGRAGTP